MKLIQVLQSKPSEMPEEMWEMLCSYEFGTIIFGLPKCSTDTPLPVSKGKRSYIFRAPYRLNLIFPFIQNVIADGDLDGDCKLFL